MAAPPFQIKEPEKHIKKTNFIPCAFCTKMPLNLLTISVIMSIIRDL